LDRPEPAAPRPTDLGGAATGFLVAVGVAAFFYFGGDAEVNINKPDVSVSASPDK
jgi:hypothetical protein